ncbi:MAG: hypothetical protein IJY27_03720 [Clostridia bacterium]|nr:hypothetical protein [Clostridia bacterium]
MSKTKKSGSAIFMYCVIAAGVAIAAVSFALYYSGTVRHAVLLWTGITAFTVTYHFWLRIIMGNVTKLFGVHYKHPWFRERAFERGLYKLLRVRKWKEKVLTYDPAAFSVKDHTLEEIANTMSKAETDHWINELISLTTLLFAIPWGAFWIFLITCIAAMLFDAQFIVVQRFNRPIVVRVIEKKRQRAAMIAQ